MTKQVKTTTMTNDEQKTHEQARTVFIFLG